MAREKFTFALEYLVVIGAIIEAFLIVRNYKFRVPQILLNLVKRSVTAVVVWLERVTALKIQFELSTIKISVTMDRYRLISLNAIESVPFFVKVNDFLIGSIKVIKFTPIIFTTFFWRQKNSLDYIVVFVGIKLKAPVYECGVIKNYRLLDINDS